VAGSIAAYKVPILVRQLMAGGAEVRVLMTPNAQHFIGPATLAGLTGRRVETELFGGEGEPHVELAAESDLILVAPATADLLARVAHGRASDLISATLLCAQCPVVVAPAMHPKMWNNPITQRNARRLGECPGWSLVGPAYGEVASGEVGIGRLVEPEQLVAAVEQRLAAADEAAALRRERPGLVGRRVVVTAGPTVEDLDPVRCLTNRSSGKMGFAIAASLVERGAAVTLIAGPVSLPTPGGVRRIDVRSALEMQAALDRALGPDLSGADALVMCAAVSDYRPRTVRSDKIKRQAEEVTLSLVQNPDLLREVGQARKGSRPFLLGFAVETAEGEALLEAARGKLLRKGCDAIVANAAADALGTDDTRATLVTREGATPLGEGSKAQIADALSTFLARQLGKPL
jgi:phosphopantothenoylcysteine decarboxylase/phosphopantothenate--cysteine ligase